MKQKYLLALDQGTSSTRALVLDTDGNVLGQAQQEFQQHFPNDGWVEHDPEQIWQSVLNVLSGALSKAAISANEVIALGITNQRETTVLWDKKTSEVIYPAIVWQDRRTAGHCKHLVKEGYETVIRDKTGLLLDPYFSATKIQWILENVPQAAKLVAKKRLAFGTIDSFLLWRLTNGNVHATDATNASRTLLFNIHDQRWDPELLALFSIPIDILPEVKDCNSHFANVAAGHLGAEIPITGIAGDQHAAMFGQACFEPGMVKATYGTGAFILMNIGKEAVINNDRLLTTVAYRLNGETTYGIEGSIFNAGTAVKWLRDGLGIIKTADETEDIAKSLEHNAGVYMVPSFTGLGAPFWDAYARGAIVGLTQNVNRAHITRAALESVCYRSRDLLECIPMKIAALRVDGGMVVNNWLLQFLADLIGEKVQRPNVIETTALGVAYLAAYGAGVYTSLDDVSNRWQSESEFVAKLPSTKREQLYAGWQRAVARVLEN